jgi:leader peptidase (prepilin peptidase) / N-methyltransferase
MLAAVVVGAAVAGAGWGLVLPGLISRYAVPWPDGEPKPPWRTTCVHCDADRSPWWRASGPCPSCGRRPSPGRPITVPLSATVCGIVAAAIGPVPELPAFIVLAAVSVPLALVDLKVLRLPDPLILAGLVGGVVLLTVAALVNGTYLPLVRGGIAAVACGVIYFLIALIPRSGLGFGDVKLGALLGLYLGWLGVLYIVVGLMLAPVLNLPLVLGLLATRRAGRRTSVPYGPALIAAAFAAVILSALR